MRVRTGVTPEPDVLFRVNFFDREVEWRVEGALIVDQRLGSPTRGQEVDLESPEFNLEAREIFSAALPEARESIRLTREGYIGLPVSVRRRIEPDLEQGRAIHNALDLVRNELGVPGAVDLEMVVRHGNLFRASEGDRTAGIESELIANLSDSAAIAARVLREAEGERLETDLLERLDAIMDSLSVIEVRAPKRLTEYRERLQQAVIELSEQVQVEDERLAREVAYLAERWDINEELVRFRSHVDLFRETLTGDGSEPVGKRLGFLTQEMNREANTIGSKANDIEVSRASVALKEEIERIREQVENVE